MNWHSLVQINLHMFNVYKNILTNSFANTQKEDDGMILSNFYSFRILIFFMSL